MDFITFTCCLITFANGLDPDQAHQTLGLVWRYSWNKFLKNNIEINQQMTKHHEKHPAFIYLKLINP